MLLFVQRRAAGNVSASSLRLFSPNRHIVIFHSGIHYVKLLLDGKGCRDAGLVSPRAQYDNLTILYRPDNQTV